MSVGIATYPIDGASVTDLLSATARVLGEAKASGGDSIRTADRSAPPAEDAAAFNVLQGLVFAIDTKDRYTRALRGRGAVFGLPGPCPGTGRRHHRGDPRRGTAPRRGQGRDPRGRSSASRRSSRQPRWTSSASTSRWATRSSATWCDGPRTARDPPSPRTMGRLRLPRRASRREIPLVARILGVGDAFSAMTTTRPTERR